MSSQHDEAPARAEESAPPAGPGSGSGPGPEASTDSAPAAPAARAAAASVTFDSATNGPPQAAGAAPYGQTDTAGPVATAGAAGPVATTGGKAARSTPWKTAADGRTVFRRGTPVVIWWVWVAFAIYNVAQIAIPDHDYFSLELTAGLLAVTALVYACTVRSRVLADNDGILVHNPFRDHRIRWGALAAVYLGDSVELGCTRPAPKKEKTIYCWALYSGRRGRMKAKVRAERDRARSGTGVFRRGLSEVHDLARQDIVQLMAAEIGRRSTDAKRRGVPDAVLESAWAWWPLAYLVVPAAVLLGLVLGR